MHRHQPYQQYATATPTTTRYSGTSSAFSASANPNEDWTKISDLAERRRIQNRIAQRNYRKKLKKRLEDLERSAASSSASPEQNPAELQPPQTYKNDDSDQDSDQDSNRGPDHYYSEISPRHSRKVPFTSRYDFSAPLPAVKRPSSALTDPNKGQVNHTAKELSEKAFIVAGKRTSSMIFRPAMPLKPAPSIQKVKVTKSTISEDDTISDAERRRIQMFALRETPVRRWVPPKNWRN